MSSSDVDRTLRTMWGLTRGARQRRRIQEELADHLREAVVAERAGGLEGAEAERRAVDRFGDPGTIARAFPPSRWGWPAAALALAATAALVWVEVTTREASIRTCFGQRCPIWMPRAPQHPIEQRVEVVTAVAAAALAVAFAGRAGWCRHRAAHAYRAAVGGDAGPTARVSTVSVLLEALRWPARLTVLGLAVVVVAGGGLAVHWQTQAPPPTAQRVVALRPEVLGHHPGQLTGVARARPLLRRILSQMPSDFVSVGVHPGQGLVIRSPSWVDTEPRGTSDPSLMLAGLEWQVLVTAFVAHQGSVGIHIVRVSGERLGRRNLAAATSMPGLAAHVRTGLKRLGLHLVSLQITHPYGPLVIAVTRAPDPRRYIERPPGALNGRITWGALVIEDSTGTVRAVFTARPGASSPGVWFDPRLFPAQPWPGSRGPPPAPRVKPATASRAPRA